MKIPSNYIQDQVRDVTYLKRKDDPWYTLAFGGKLKEEYKYYCFNSYSGWCQIPKKEFERILGKAVPFKLV